MWRTQAAQRAFLRSSIRPEQINTIVSTSVCKDYIEPSVAALVHGKLGLSSHCTNFDVGNACLGFLTGDDGGGGSDRTWAEMPHWLWLVRVLDCQLKPPLNGFSTPMLE